MATQFSAAQELPRYDEAYERRSRMRALHAEHVRHHRPRPTSAFRRHLREGLDLGWYLIRLTVHSLGFGLLMVAMLAAFYLLG